MVFSLRLYLNGLKRKYSKKTLNIFFIVIIFISILELISLILSVNTSITDLEVDYISQIYGSVVNPLPLKDRKIPKLIHLFSENGFITQDEQVILLSWLKNHPDYKFALWTKENIDRFMHVKFYDTYKLIEWEVLNWNAKSNISRYFVIFLYGGVSFNLNIKSYSSIDSIVSRFSCVFAREPFFHSVYYRNSEQFLDDSFFACAPKHPFMSAIINDVKSAYSTSIWDFMCAHPICKHFDVESLNDVFQEYLIENKIEMTLYPHFAVYTPLSDHFIPSGIKWNKMEKDLESCSCFLSFAVYRVLNNLRQQACCHYHVLGLPPVSVQPIIDRNIVNSDSLNMRNIPVANVVPKPQLKYYPNIKFYE